MYRFGSPGRRRGIPPPFRQCGEGALEQGESEYKGTGTTPGSRPSSRHPFTVARWVPLCWMSYFDRRIDRPYRSNPQADARSSQFVAKVWKLRERHSTHFQVIREVGHPAKG